MHAVDQKHILISISTFMEQNDYLSFLFSAIIFQIYFEVLNLSESNNIVTSTS